MPKTFFMNKMFPNEPRNDEESFLLRDIKMCAGLLNNKHHESVFLLLTLILHRHEQSIDNQSNTQVNLIKHRVCGIKSTTPPSLFFSKT